MPEMTPYRELESERNADFVYKGFTLPADTRRIIAGYIETQCDTIESIAHSVADDITRWIIDAIADPHIPQ